MCHHVRDTAALALAWCAGVLEPLLAPCQAASRSRRTAASAICCAPFPAFGGGGAESACSSRVPLLSRSFVFFEPLRSSLTRNAQKNCGGRNSAMLACPHGGHRAQACGTAVPTALRYTTVRPPRDSSRARGRGEARRRPSLASLLETPRWSGHPSPPRGPSPRPLRPGRGCPAVAPTDTRRSRRGEDSPPHGMARRLAATPACVRTTQWTPSPRNPACSTKLPPKVQAAHTFPKPP